MTIIKLITVKGFKSFDKKTELIFGNNFNCILGPNGAGKSNIVDALCFVLGKISAKGLRAEKSANLIYNGGKKKNPAKEAEVNVIFDNSNKKFPIDSKEVIISRMVKQSGNSVYRLNDDVVTRQQIVDLLNNAKIDPDGHNIILQGDIVKFMEMRNVERRELIEEVSGISVYEDKKQKALNDLEKVEAKLNDTNIIMKERETYLKELRKDRDQALKYKELQGSIRRNKATYLSLQIKDKEARKEEVDKKINEQKKNVGRVNNKLRELRKDIETSKEEIKKINEEVESKGEIEQQKLHKEIEDLKTDIVKDSTRLDTCRNEITKIETRKVQLEKNIRDIKDETSRLVKRKEELLKERSNVKGEEEKVNGEIEKFRKRHNLIELEKIEEELGKEEEEYSTLIYKKQELQRNLDRLNLQVENLGDVKEEQGKVKELRNDFKSVTVELSKLLNESSVIANQLNRARSNLIKNNEELAKIRIINNSGRESFIGDLAIKKILELKNDKIYGLVSDLGEVDSKYAIALGVAAGTRIKSIVVEDDITAEKCIKYLKDNKLGPVTFLPLNKVKGNSRINISNIKGVLGRAMELVKFDNKFRNIFSYVFGDTIVIEDINVARKIGIGKIRMVTLDGDLMEVSGAMIGGFRRAVYGFKQRDLGKDISEREKESSRLRDIIDTLEKRKIEVEDRIFELKGKKLELESRLSKFGDVKDTKEKRDSIVNGIRVMERESRELDKTINSLYKEINVLKSKRKLSSNQNVNNKLNELDKKRQEIIERLMEINGEVNNIQLQVDSIYGKENEKILQIIKDSEKEKERFIEEVNELNKKILENKTNLKEKEKIEKKFYSEFKNLFVKRNKINEVVNKKESLLLGEEEKIRNFEHRINSFNLDRAKIIAELEGLNVEFVEYSKESLRRGVSLEELKYEIKKFESMMNNMGNVNLRALEVYERIEEEYHNILGKIETLKEEKEDVLDMIKEVDDKKKDIFMKTFNVLNNNFKKTFSQLSTKGEAHLELEDKDDIFNNGVDIKVKITGNKFLDIKSLSGGEKTMTALAFIFAVQEYQPASFYLLDEVDAALDKTNSVLLSKLIQKYAQKAQYIVVSHNDTIISEADQIYGISMKEGISKVVSLKI